MLTMRSTVPAGLARRVGQVAVAALVTLLGATGCSDDGGDGVEALGGGGDGDVGDSGSPGGDLSDDEAGQGGGAAAEGSDQAGGSGSSLDLCSLLLAPEVQAQFGDLGPVAEGHESIDRCVWEVGEPTAVDAGEVVVTDLLAAEDDGSGRLSAEAGYDGFREYQRGGANDDPVDVDGVGDEAFHTTFLLSPALVFRSGDALLMVEAAFVTTPDGVQEKLAELARHIVERV